MDRLSTEPVWQFEPKWDGFRCLASKATREVELRARSARSLARYFFGMVAALHAASAIDVVLVGVIAKRIDAPYEPSARPIRWSNERSTAREPLRTELVAEIGDYQFTGTRFRHGTTFLRWRPDRTSARCAFEPLQQEAGPGRLISGVSGSRSG